MANPLWRWRLWRFAWASPITMGIIRGWVSSGDGGKRHPRWIADSTGRYWHVCGRLFIREHLPVLIVHGEAARHAEDTAAWNSLVGQWGVTAAAKVWNEPTDAELWIANGPVYARGAKGVG